MAARIVDAAFALVYLRVLGPANTGSYTQLVVLTTYLDTLIDFGLNALVAREVPRSPGIATSAFRGVALLRSGKRDAALAEWKDLLAAAPAEADWRPLVEDGVMMLERPQAGS